VNSETEETTILSEDKSRVHMQLIPPEGERKHKNGSQDLNQGRLKAQARKALLERLRLRRKQKAELATKRQERISLLAKNSQYPSLQRELLVGSWNSLHSKFTFSFIMVGEDVR